MEFEESRQPVDISDLIEAQLTPYVKSWEMKETSRIGWINLFNRIENVSDQVRHTGHLPNEPFLQWVAENNYSHIVEIGMGIGCGMVYWTDHCPSLNCYSGFESNDIAHSLAVQNVQLVNRMCASSPTRPPGQILYVNVHNAAVGYTGEAIRLAENTNDAHAGVVITGEGVGVESSDREGTALAIVDSFSNMAQYLQRERTHESATCLKIFLGNPCDAIVIDVNGGHMDVLESQRCFIQPTKADIFVCNAFNLSEYEREDIQNFLTPMGYTPKLTPLNVRNAVGYTHSGE